MILQIRFVAEKVDWVIIAGGDGTIRALIEKLSNRKYVPYISVFPAGTVNLVAKELLVSNDPGKWFKRVSKGVEVPAIFRTCQWACLSYCYGYRF